MEKNASKKLDKSTEEKIKSAARLLFQQKGFAGTKTRDIAEAAGINLALLNYYFRSKEKLFELIMKESLGGFFSVLKNIFNDPNSTFEEKIEQLADTYISNLLLNPDIPTFILSEVRNNPETLLAVMNSKTFMIESVFLAQLQEKIKQGECQPIHPMHFLMNLLGMTVFPFVSKPMLLHLGIKSESDFTALLEERKKLIPIWIKAMLKT
jgi:AcrR family transcriptional regulator